MTRRSFVSLSTAGALAARPAEGLSQGRQAEGLSQGAQERFPGTVYRDYSRGLPDYLRGLARQAYERRNRELAKLTMPEAVRARQAWQR